VPGLVEETIPGARHRIRLPSCALDTDFEASTQHELTHLYPRLARGGVVIVDDHGHFPTPGTPVAQEPSPSEAFLLDGALNVVPACRLEILV